MTPLDFINAGVRFEHTPDHRIAVRGPRDEGLLADLKAEVERRMPVLQDLAAARAAVGKQPQGQCETCGEQIPVVLPSGEIHLGCARGMCPLCGLARRKVVGP